MLCLHLGNRELIISCYQITHLQGGWENDETVQEAAVREAMEEAGVRGELMVKYIFLFFFLS